MTNMKQFHETYKKLILQLWAEYHIIPDDTIQYLKYRQLGRRKAREFLDTKLRKIISFNMKGEDYDEEHELRILRAKVLEEINKELEKKPLKWK